MSIRTGRALLIIGALVFVAVVTAAVAAFVVPRHLKARRSVRELESIATDLRSGDADVRSKAADRLSALEKGGLTVDAGLVALTSAAGAFPAAEGLEDGGALLVAAAAEHPAPRYAPLVVLHFAQYSPKARFWAMRLLANLDRGGGADSVLAILRQHATACEDVDLSQALSPMVPNGASKLFPGILESLQNERMGTSVAYLAYEAVSQGSVPDRVLEPYSDALLALYLRKRDLLVPRQGTQGHRWMWEDAYVEPRDHAGLLLDLFGHVPSDPIRRELARAMTDYTDPKLLTFAAGSLVRLGERVSPDAWESIAAHAEMRNTLYDLLVRSSRSDLFPRRYRTQEAFAESDLVNWLVYPTELGQVPDHIELMKVVTSGAPGEEEDYYVFRFRMDEPHWAAKDGWMAGVAGGFARRDQPTTVAGGHTFSSFTAWDSQTPEEHVGGVTDLLSEAWKKKAKEAGGSSP